MESNSYEIFIDTPDGDQKITQWFNKGLKPCISLTVNSGLTTICASNHLLEVFDERSSTYKWVEACNIFVGDEVLSVNSKRDKVIKVHETNEQECFDFTVEHPNHRYWGDGLSSHNSGKSYLCSGNIVKNAQEQGVFVVLIDTENALDEQWLTSLGVDTSPAKLQRVSVSMIDDLAKFTSEFVKSYKQEFSDIPAEDRPQVLFVIDSLGMLMTPTEVNQFQGGDMKGDMGRGAKQRKAYIMNCVNMLGDLNIGLVMTNHTYESQDMFSPDPKVHGGCLTDNHMVLMANGDQKSIKDVVVGDKVQTLYGARTVQETFVFEKPTYNMSIGDTVVECSDTHRFLVKDNDEMVWVCAKDLKVDNEIISIG